MQYYQLEAGDTSRARLDQLAPATTALETSLWFTYLDKGPPGIVPDYFAGLLDFWIKIEQAGERQFNLDADDRVYLWLDGWRRDVPAAGATTDAPLTGERTASLHSGL
jgi:hypothetical protein